VVSAVDLDGDIPLLEEGIQISHPPDASCRSTCLVGFGSRKFRQSANKSSSARLCDPPEQSAAVVSSSAGIGSYNSPDAYNALVTAAANRYAQASLA
jgi:hypothetical protein